MRFIRRFFATCLLLALIGGIWAGIYAQKKGFSKTWRQLVEAEFAKRGYFIDIGKLTLGPFQGLVAEDLQFYQDPERKQELAFVDNVILDLNLSQILHRDLSINTLDVHDASLALPLIPGKRDSEKLVIDNFSGRLVVTESQIEVVTASAKLHGIEVSMKGSLHRPSQSPRQPAKVVEQEEKDAQRETLRKMRRNLDRVQDALREIDKFEFDPQSPPRLELKFGGDLGNLRNMSATARLVAEHVRRGPYVAEKLSIWMELDGEKDVLALRELHIRDGKGDLRLEGEWAIGGDDVAFDLETDADVSTMLTAVYPRRTLGEVVFYQPPRLKVAGKVHLDQLDNFKFPNLPVTVEGEFNCERLTSRGAVFDGLSFQFSVEGDRFYVLNLHLDHKTGVLLANFLYEPSAEKPGERFRYLTEVKLDPGIFEPFFKKEATKRLLRSLDFDDNSAIYLFGSGGGSDLNPQSWDNTGVIDFRNFRYNEVRFEQAESEFAIAGPLHTFSKVRLVREEGEARSEDLHFDGMSQQWTIGELRSSLSLAEGLRAFCPKVASSFKPYKFTKSPEIVIRGLIDGRLPEAVGDTGRNHQFEIDFISNQPAGYEFLGRELPLENPGGVLKVAGDGVKLENFRSDLFGGKLWVSFEAENLAKSKEYRAEVTLDAVPFSALSRLYSDYQSSEGNLSGNMKFGGTIGDVRSIDATGYAAIENGDVFAIPTLGPLSKLISEIIPSRKAGYSVATQATASLRMKNGILSTDDFEANARTFQFKGKGSVDCVAQTIDFDAKINTKFAPTRVLLSPLSKLLEFSCEGPISDPEWRPKLIPKGLKLPDLEKLLPNMEKQRESR